MSFDPQNPRGAPRPPDPQPAPSSNPKPGDYIPPQPVNSSSGLPPAVLVGGVIVVVAILAFIAFAVFGPRNITPSLPPTQAAPTVATSPRSSSVPYSAAPTTAASVAPPTFAGSPPAGFDAFLLHVPDAIRPTCQATPPSDATILFSASCTTSDGIVVMYDRYADSASMDAAYQAAFAAQEIDAGTGSCEDHATWPAESAYQVEGQPAGRRLCADIQGAPAIYWTDERLTIYSSARGTDPLRLVQFWTNEAGPIQ